MSEISATMNWVDYFILGIILLSGLVSFLRGFVLEALSLAVWVVAFWVAMLLSGNLAALLVDYISLPSARSALSFLGLFLAVLVVGALFNYLIAQLIKKTGISGTDRVLGMFFGLARGILLIAVVTLLAGFTPVPGDPWWQESQLLVKFEQLALWMRGYLPPEFAELLDFG